MKVQKGEEVSDTFIIEEWSDLEWMQNAINERLSEGYILKGEMLVVTQMVDDGRSGERQNDSRKYRDVPIHTYSQAMIKETGNK